MDIAKNIRIIRNQKSINQQNIADELGVDVAAVSNIESGKRQVKVNELEKIAKALDMSVVDLITYPKKYVEKQDENESFKTIIQLELKNEKKEQILKLIFGDKNLELLKK